MHTLQTNYIVSHLLFSVCVTVFCHCVKGLCYIFWNTYFSSFFYPLLIIKKSSYLKCYSFSEMLMDILCRYWCLHFTPKSCHCLLKFFRGRIYIFSNHGLTTKTKIIVFRAVVHLSTLLYACKTWTLYCQDIKRLEQFQQSSEESFTSMRSSLGHLYPASRLPSFKITYTEWVTCPECVPLNSHVSFCLEDSPATRGYTEAQNDTSRIS